METGFHNQYTRIAVVFISAQVHPPNPHVCSNVSASAVIQKSRDCEIDFKS